MTAQPATSDFAKYRKFDDPQHRRELGAVWNVEEEELPQARGLAYPSIIEAALHRRIKALSFIVNPGALVA